MQAICTRLNPWGFSRSAIELQLTFKRLCDGAAGSDTRAQAESDLEKFTTSFLGHALTPGETDLVADVLRGISGPVAERVSVNTARKTSLPVILNCFHSL
jgi:mediator of RNA polymerase II transcription subunit 12